MCRVMHLLIGCEDGRGSSFLNFRFEQKGGGLNGRCSGPPGTLLHWAVLKDKVELATLLLSKNANVEALDDEEQTPLFAAAALAWVAGHSGMVELLLERHAHPDTPTLCQRTNSASPSSPPHSCTSNRVFLLPTSTCRSSALTLIQKS